MKKGKNHKIVIQDILVSKDNEIAKQATELALAHAALDFQNKEKGNRAAELIIANNELAFQKAEKKKRAAELAIANTELIVQNAEKKQRTKELIISNSNLKKAKKEILMLNEEMEQKVIERTFELEAANKDLESFSYSISHDLRAPLRSVKSFTQMLKEDYGEIMDSNANKLLDRIALNTKRMGHLIDDLLRFSRIVRREMERKEISMNDLVTAICEEITNEGVRDISFTIHPLLPAIGDASAVRQVWVNLISNAVKYSSKKERTIIEINSIVKENEIIYSIKDNGAGFDMRYAHKLFGVFQRLHSEKQFEGTGIGLAIVHRIIYKHGGRVWAESKKNEGSVFYFVLNQN
jgi:light-regulated signal transduction histidine kinase (bacteriophytochrome)